MSDVYNHKRRSMRRYAFWRVNYRIVLSRLLERWTALFRCATKEETREAAAATAAHNNGGSRVPDDDIRQKKADGRLFPRKPNAARYYHRKNVGTDGYVRNSRVDGYTNVRTVVGGVYRWLPDGGGRKGGGRPGDEVTAGWPANGRLWQWRRRQPDTDREPPRERNGRNTKRNTCYKTKSCGARSPFDDIVTAVMRTEVYNDAFRTGCPRARRVVRGNR